MTELDPELEPEHAHVLLLVNQVCGAIALDRAMAYFGVAKRTAERWLGGKPLPPPVLAKLEADADLVDGFMSDLEDFIDDQIDKGVPEHVIRMRLREHSKTLRETPAVKPGEEAVSGQ